MKLNFEEFVGEIMYEQSSLLLKKSKNTTKMINLIIKMALYCWQSRLV